MTTDDRTPIVVDLIGDLDETLVASVSEMLAGFAEAGPAYVLLSARYLAGVSADALAALGVAVDDARGRGAAIEVDPGNRKMRQAFGEAHIDHSNSEIPRPSGARHYMMARHAEAQPLIRA
jgi:anti-anti-sigma regulatory factor